MPILLPTALAQWFAHKHQQHRQQATGKGNQESMCDRGTIHEVQVFLLTGMHHREGGGSPAHGHVTAPCPIGKTQPRSHRSQEVSQGTHHLRHHHEHEEDHLEDDQQGGNREEGEQLSMHTAILPHPIQQGSHRT